MSTRLTDEIRRLTAAPPDAGSAQYSLGAFEVAVENSPYEYAARVRHALSAAVKVARDCDFDVDELPVDSLPTWFTSASSPELSSTSTDHLSEQGARLYESQRGEDRWNVQEWISCFDPKLRHWSWWDITQCSENSVKVWVDTRDEAVVGCEELRWLMFVSGARSVSEMALVPGSDWSPEDSIGWASTTD